MPQAPGGAGASGGRRSRSIAGPCNERPDWNPRFANLPAVAYLNLERLEALDPTAYQTRDPYPFVNPEGLLAEVPKDRHDTIPHFIKSAITTPDDWKRIKAERLNVDHPDRRLKPEMYVTAQIDVAVGAGGHAATPTARGAFACPMHTWETADTLTICPICEMDMVPVESLPGHTEPRAAEAVLSVPTEAVMRTGQRSLVYVETDAGVYRGVEIKIGPVAQDETGRRLYPVLEGLEEGQKVVTRGNFVIDSQMQLAGKPSLFNARGLGTQAMHRHGD